MAVQQITGSLDDEAVVNHFKKQSPVHISRTEHDYLLTDKICVVRVPNYTSLAPFALDPTWQRATFISSKEVPTEAGPDLEAKWKAWEALEVEGQLALTHELLEVPGSVKGKPGIFYRKFALGPETYLYDKRVLDMLSPDLDELEGFLFEQMKNERGLMRVSAKYGHVAFVMPCTIRQI